MQFFYPYNLFLLLVIPLLLFFRIFSERRRRKDITSFSEEEMFFRITDVDEKIRNRRYLLFLGGLFFLIVALARPQFGQKLQEIKQYASDIVVAVDVSESMCAADVKPSRLLVARKCISLLVSQLSGNRLGIIAFAGVPFWQCPLTFDFSSVNLFLDILNKNLIPLPGTNIGEAIYLAVDGLKKSPPGTKAVVLITDGENLQGEVSPAIDYARKSGVKIYCLGIGTEEGEPIPVYDENGNFSGYKKDRQGNVVVSRLNKDLLTDIASKTGGEFWNVDAQTVESVVVQLLDNLSGLEKKKLSSRFFRQYEERYQIFLFLAFILFVGEMFLNERKKQKK